MMVPTALLGHAIDPQQSRFIDSVIGETLPAVSREFPGIMIDADCEEGAWPLEDCRRLFTKARELGHPIRLHADQFNRLGGLDLAVELGDRGRIAPSCRADLVLLRHQDERLLGFEFGGNPVDVVVCAGRVVFPA